MFPPEILLAYRATVLLVIVAPGPANILAASRALSPGRTTGVLSSAGAGLGIMIHTVAAALGLARLLQTSLVAFRLVTSVVATGLLWQRHRDA